MDVVIDFPDRYVCALSRTTNLRRNAIKKNVKLKHILKETIQDMISEDWIVHVNDVTLYDIKCY